MNNNAIYTQSQAETRSDQYIKKKIKWYFYHALVPDTDSKHCGWPEDL